MKIMIIRHGDPDYVIDSLTEKGWREAAYLSERLVKTPIKAFYVSPLGRAKDTIAPTLKKLNREAEECMWLREFDVHIHRPDVKDRMKVCWDWLPNDWTAEEKFFQHNHWMDPEVMADSDVPEQYQWVIENFDRVLAKHGYVRENDYYRAAVPNSDTICFVCHFGLECVLLSRLLNISPMALWHGMCAAPSSVTTLVTEERRPGIAYFRMGSFGDISHLYANDEPPAFAARFCELYTNMDERHD